MREDKVYDNKIEVNYSNTDEINYCKENNTEKDDLSVDLMIGCTIIGMILGTITGNYMWSMAGFIGLGLGFIIEPIGKYLKSSFIMSTIKLKQQMKSLSILEKRIFIFI